jgi:opacity protein-like surface antigen
MKLKLLAGVALAAVFTATGVLAQDRGPYVAIDAGYHRPEGIEASASTPTYNWTFDAEEDFTGFARLGYRLNPNFRVELEGGYRPGDVESVRGSGTSVGLCSPGVIRSAAAAACGSPNGEIESYTLMANVIYDFFGSEARFRPFIGAGIGINRVNIDVLGQFATVPGVISGTNAQFQNLAIDDEDVTFAYQGLAGLAFQATERLALDVTYRYLMGPTSISDRAERLRCSRATSPASTRTSR